MNRFSPNQLLNLIWAVTLAVLLSGCQFDPFAHTYTTAKPDESKIVGNYQLVMQTLTTNGLAQALGQPDLFGPPDFVGAVLFLCGFLAVVATILAIIGIAGGIVAILILFSVVSSSTCAGWVTKRASFGLRTFLAQIFALGAIPLGIAATWGIVKLNAWQLPFWKVLVTGGISGLIAGLALAFALDLIVRSIFKRVFKETPSRSRAP